MIVRQSPPDRFRWWGSWLLSALGQKSSENKEHVRRIRTLALRLSESDLDFLSLLAFFHDIGQIARPGQLLQKGSELTESEWEQIKTHPEIGYHIARSSESFSHIARDILAHHERWDGAGYPRGLKGENIPFLARLLAVVDTCDGMTNGRPYQERVSGAEALRELKREAGSQFDPCIVENYVRIEKDET